MDDFTALSKRYTETINRNWAVVLTIIVITASEHLTSTVGSTYECLLSRLNDIVSLCGSFTPITRSSKLFINFRFHQHSLFNGQRGVVGKSALPTVLVKGAMARSHTG